MTSVHPEFAFKAETNCGELFRINTFLFRSNVLVRKKYIKRRLKWIICLVFVCGFFSPFTTEHSGISFEYRTIIGGKHGTKFRPAITTKTPEAFFSSSVSIEKLLKNNEIILKLAFLIWR